MSHGPGMGGDHEMTTMAPMTGMMSMAFHTGYNETILFKFWKISTLEGLLCSIVVVFMMAVAYEGLKYLRYFLLTQHKKKRSAYNGFQTRQSSCCAPVEIGDAMQTTGQKLDSSMANGRMAARIAQQPKRIKMLSSIHILQTFLHLVQFILSYFLMLIFMTYNVWLCLGVACGAATGYFFFGWQREDAQDANECCH